MGSQTWETTVLTGTGLWKPPYIVHEIISINKVIKTLAQPWIRPKVRSGHRILMDIKILLY